MKKYKTVEVSEKALEEMIRKGSDLIEEGLTYIDHQMKTEAGRLDVLFVDSGNALVIGELKVTEDDNMLVQGLDYYDYVTGNIEGLARAYKKDIDPTQQARMFLIAPSFSMSLMRRCKWIDIPISLFSFTCVRFEGEKDITPIFHEISVPARLEPIEVYSIEQNLSYITDGKAKKSAEAFLQEIQEWDKENILIEALKYDVSVKLKGRVFFYLAPRRRFFMVYSHDKDGNWVSFEDLDQAKVSLKTKYELSMAS